MSLWKPDSASVADPDKLVTLLQGLYDLLLPSGVLMAQPTPETVRNEKALLVCLTKMYGAAFIMGAKNLPRPSLSTVSDNVRLLPWLVKLYDAAVAAS